MKNKNSIGLLSFISNTLFYSLAAAVFYRIACFSPVYGMTIVHSRILYWVVVFISLSSGLLTTYKKRRNIVSVLVNIFMPIEIYTIVSTYRYMSEVYNALFIVTGVLSVVYLAIILTRKVKNRNHILPIMFNRVKFGLLGIRTIAVALMLIVTLNFCSDKMFGYGIVSSDVEADISDSAYGEWTIENNIETIAKLEPSVWETLTFSERMDVLGVVKNTQMRKFGVNHEVYLDARDLEGDVTGTYFSDDRRISIDVEHVKSSESGDVLRTVLHECMHVYQHMCVELYDSVDDAYKRMPMLSEAVRYKKNFTNYISGEEDFYEYYNQDIEISAREYAERMSDCYFFYIDDFLTFGDLTVGDNE